MKSQIRGNDNDQHIWQEIVRPTPYARRSIYRCNNCKIDFAHWCGEISDIYEEMKAANISLECKERVKEAE